MLRMYVMTPETLQKFKETVELAESIVVHAGGSYDQEKILSASVLHHAFVHLGKRSTIVIPRLTNPIERCVNALFESTLEKTSAPLPEHALIEIDTTQKPVSELKYEKDGSILKIIVRGPAVLTEKEITIKKEGGAVDLLILVDTTESESKDLAAEIPHKEVVKITSANEALAYKIFDIVKFLSDSAFKHSAEALWMLTERQRATTLETIERKKELAQHTLDTQKIEVAREALRGKGFWKILGRALQRSEHEHELRALWTFIPFVDFQKTNQTEEIIHPLFNELCMLRPESAIIALLWELPKGNIRGLVGGDNAPTLAAIAQELNCALSSSYFSIGGFSNFSEAEIKIRSAIKKVIQ